MRWLLCALQKWLKGVGKEQKRKGKRLFMPMRIALTVHLATYPHCQCCHS